MLYTITKDQLFDYMMCPVYYGIKYGKNPIKIDKPPTMSRFLNQIVTGFCLQLMMGKVTHPSILKRKWDMICREHPEYFTTEKTIEGMGYIYSFYRYASEQEIRIATIGPNYIVRVKDDENPEDTYEYHGELGIIAANKNNKPEGLKIDFSPKIPDQSLLDMDIRTSLNHIGFYLLYKQPLVGSKIHWIKKDRDYYTTRDVTTSLKKIKKIILNVGKSIKNNIWYPHQGPLCKSCELRNFCFMYGVDREV